MKPIFSLRILDRARLPLVRLTADREPQPLQSVRCVARLRIALRHRIHERFAARIDVERFLLLGDGLCELAFAREFRRCIRESIRDARRHVEQPPQFLERVLVIVDPDVDDALDGVGGIGGQWPHHEDACRLHAAGVAAFRLTGVERVHQPLGHRAFPPLVGGRHGLHDFDAGKCVALNREARASDVACIPAEMHRVLGIRVPRDHVAAGVDRGHDGAEGERAVGPGDDMAAIAEA